MEINGVTIQMLPAASGDCIYLEFPDSDFRMLIDGGYAKTYQKYLKKFLRNLAAEGKRLNLIVVTHIDNDHINGIKALLRENGDAKDPQIIGIDEIWFNGLDQCIAARKSEQTMTFSLENILESMSPSEINLDYENGSQDISYISGCHLAQLIQSGDYRWNISTPNSLVCNEQTILFGDLKIKILNPTIEILNEMKENWLHYLNEKCHKNIEITKASLFDAAFEGFFLNNEIDVEIEQEEISYSDESSNWLDEYTENKEAEMDSKTTNCSSISLLLEYKNLKMLFPGDSPIQLFEKELPKEFDLIKLPHHGSIKNISLEFIKNTKVKYYLLSKNFYLQRKCR